MSQSDGPEQVRLRESMLTSTLYHSEASMAAMKNQWKVSSNYVAERPSTPLDVPIEYTPGSTASGWRRSFKGEINPFEATTNITNKFTWPPPVPKEYQLKKFSVNP